MSISLVSDFEVEVAAESKLVLQQIQEQYQEFITSVVTDLIKITPVDTGHAKGNWQVGLNVKPEGEIEFLDPTPVGTGGKALQAAKIVIDGIDYRFTKTIWVVNNTDYIARIIEDGHSLQTPPGSFSAVVQKYNIS